MINERRAYINNQITSNSDATGITIEVDSILGEDKLDEYKEEVKVIDKYKSNIKSDKKKTYYSMPFNVYIKLLLFLLLRSMQLESLLKMLCSQIHIHLIIPLIHQIVLIFLESRAQLQTAKWMTPYTIAISNIYVIQPSREEKCQVDFFTRTGQSIGI